MSKPTRKLDREAIRKTLVLMLLANATPGDDGVRVHLPALTKLIRRPSRRARSAP